MSWLKTLLQGKPPVPACALLLLQRSPVPRFDHDFVLSVVESAWGRSFSEGHPYWFISSVSDNTSAMISYGGPKVTVFIARHPEFDQDRPTDKLPAIAERAAWGPYAERIEVDSFGDTMDPNARFGLAAKMTLALLNENCTGIYDSFHQQLMPVNNETIAWLQQWAAQAPGNDVSPPIGPTAGIVLLLHQPVVLDEATLKAAAVRGFGRPFPDSVFWDIAGGTRPSYMADGKGVEIRQSTGPVQAMPGGIVRSMLDRAGATQWPSHAARLAFTSVSGSGDDNFAIRHGAVASSALGFLDGNCLGVYDSVSGYFWANPGEAVPVLQGIARGGPQASNPIG